jgi:hypothetical protein
VAELTSMLAGERFSDHPRCACPALTAFLRGYNDSVTKRLRQDLYALASELVGTRADESTTTMRGERLVELAWQFERKLGPVRISPAVNFQIRFDRYAGAGIHLGRCARHNPACHRAVLDLLTELCETPASRDFGSRPWQRGRRAAAGGEELAQQRGTFVS